MKGRPWYVVRLCTEGGSVDADPIVHEGPVWGHALAVARNGVERGLYLDVRGADWDVGPRFLNRETGRFGP